MLTKHEWNAPLKSKWINESRMVSVFSIIKTATLCQSHSTCNVYDVSTVRYANLNAHLLLAIYLVKQNNIEWHVDLMLLFCHNNENI